MELGSQDQLSLNQFPIDQLPTGSTPIKSTSMKQTDKQSGSHCEWSFQGYNEHYGSGRDGGTTGGHTSARTMIKDLAPYQPNTVSLLQSYIACHYSTV